MIEDDEVVAMLEFQQPSGQRLREGLERIVLERGPVPPSSPMRVFVEIYPIAETALWLTASLYDTQEVRARGTV
jgi:hypothetical protein